MMESCRGCGAPLPDRRPLKQFCKYACRGRSRIAEATNYRTGLIGSKNTKQRKALRAEKRASVAGYAFAKVNSCPVRLDRPNKRGAGWLMEVGWPGDARIRWVARVGNRASEPLPLDEAKRAAVAMLRERGKGDPQDFIARLNQIAASGVDRAAPMPTLTEVMAVERANFPPLTKPPALQSAPDIEIETYADGYPRLPDGLRRIQKGEVNG
jgi:hypothetical protein